MGKDEKGGGKEKGKYEKRKKNRKGEGKKRRKGRNLAFLYLAPSLQNPRSATAAYLFELAEVFVLSQLFKIRDGFRIVEAVVVVHFAVARQLTQLRTTEQ